MADLGTIRDASTTTATTPVRGQGTGMYIQGDSAQPYGRTYAYNNNGGPAPAGPLGAVTVCNAGTLRNVNDESLYDMRARSRQVNGQTQIDGTPTNQVVTIRFNGAPIRVVKSTPTVIVRDLPPGNYEVTVDGQGAKRSESWGPTTVAAPSRLSLSGTLAACSSGVAYSDGLDAAGGYGTNTWDIYGSLPSGLSFNTSTGLITGTTVATGSYYLEIGVTQDTKRLWKGVTLTVA